MFIPRKSSLAAQWGALTLGACLALGVGAAQAGPTDGCTPIVLPTPTSGKDICYGTASWLEPTLSNKKLTQRFDFYPAASNKPTPLIIWAHPNEMSKALPTSGAMYKALVSPALAAGFSFASLEFRHPVVNESEASSNNGVVPHLDVARALQYIRANAQALNIDPANVFFVGQSRGTLALWTALQDDMADPNSSDPVARQSTRVNAVFGVNAQTTYDGLEFDSLFLVPRDRPQADADFIAQHPYYQQFGSAIKSVNAGLLPDPAVKLRYDSKPIKHLLTYDEMLQLDYIHYADFGLALCNAYLNAFGDTSRCLNEASTSFADNPAAAYANYVDFFKKRLVIQP
ncbi:MAG: hypothetical protein KGL57_02850 [Burkholderiales bacterium]|nr:hypothetical protein [Burkholderiales bacterium]